MPQPSIIADRPRILIIDDERNVRDLLMDTLSSEYDCACAGTVEEVDEMLSIGSYPVVLSDIDLGRGTSGNQLIPKIRRSSPDTVVVMISGNQGIDCAIEAMRAGAFDFIKKPFDLSYLDFVVSRALEHHLLLKERRRNEEELEELVRQRTDELNFLSFFDPLTGLPNRALFEDRVSQALLSPEGKDGTSLLLISLDGFRKVRETFGHRVSDAMLIETSKRLTDGIGQHATVSRYERDEFAILLTDNASEEDLASTAREIASAFRKPFLLDGNDIVVTTSIGISTSGFDGKDLITLMRNATAALARAKEYGGDAVRFYTADMNLRALQRRTLETGLWRALERDEFELFYQPKVDIESGRVSGLEALVRWQHPDMGMISPAEFIPLAEETGLITSLGEVVLRKAISQARIWSEMGFDLEVAVNLSARQLKVGGLSDSIEGIIDHFGFDPAKLNLEITESSFLDSWDDARSTLWSLKRSGIKISLDDFGTGYSSLSYLRRLPIDVLKIDKSFINEIPTNPDDSALAAAIITLGHNLRMKVVAEGVEKVEQLEFLRRLRCDEYQGYLFSKPLPADEFEQLLIDRSIDSQVVSPDQFPQRIQGNR